MCKYLLFLQPGIFSFSDAVILQVCHKTGILISHSLIAQIFSILFRNPSIL